ncbi:MAG: hypothetical protein H8E60_00600 [Candidatus Marinimicrobia bacterium]|nr:hypothetical protein [Candidatus Neomarinimicrobiota bacterium]
MTINYNSTMHFKLLLISSLISIGVGQSFFNKTFGYELTENSPRAMGLGYTTSLSSVDSYSLIANPANLINPNKSISIFAQSRIIRTNERRSFVLKDSFGDFLTNADYVANKNSSTVNSFGISINKNIGKNIISGGVAYVPLYSYSSSYREEVRGSVSCEDGVPCTRDALSGYHNFNSDGLLNGTSLGFSGKFLTSFANIKLGISVTKTNSVETSYNVFTEILNDEVSNLSEIPNTNIINIFDSGTFSNFGFVIESNRGAKFSYLKRSQLKLNSQLDYLGGLYNQENGLLEYLTNIESPDTNFIELNYTNAPFVIPQKTVFGLSYSPKALQQTELFFEIDLLEYLDEILISTSPLSDDVITPNIKLPVSKSYKFGIEYNMLNETTLRAGLAYKESPIPGINSESIITCGYSKTINQLTYDFGFSINQNEYYYPDIFPVENDPRPNYDKVKESYMNISLAIQYSF